MKQQNEYVCFTHNAMVVMETYYWNCIFINLRERVWNSAVKVKLIFIKYILL